MEVKKFMTVILVLAIILVMSVPAFAKAAFAIQTKREAEKFLFVMGCISYQTVSYTAENQAYNIKINYNSYILSVNLTKGTLSQRVFFYIFLAGTK